MFTIFVIFVLLYMEADLKNLLFIFNIFKHLFHKLISTELTILLDPYADSLPNLNIQKLYFYYP